MKKRKRIVDFYIFKQKNNFWTLSSNKRATHIVDIVVLVDSAHSGFSHFQAEKQLAVNEKCIGFAIKKV